MQKISNVNANMNKDRAELLILQKQLQDIKNNEQKKIKDMIRNKSGIYFSQPLSVKEKIHRQYQKELKEGIIDKNMTVIEYFFKNYRKQELGQE